MDAVFAATLPQVTTHSNHSYACTHSHSLQLDGVVGVAVKAAVGRHHAAAWEAYTSLALPFHASLTKLLGFSTVQRISSHHITFDTISRAGLTVDGPAALTVGAWCWWWW